MNNITASKHTTFYLSVDEHSAFTCLLAVKTNNAAMYVTVEIPIYVLTFTFVYIPSYRIAGSYDNSVFNFFEELP